MLLCIFLSTNKCNIFEGHIDIIQRLQQIKKDSLRQEFRNINKGLEAADSGVLEVTARMIRTVYVEVKSNIPFTAHRNIVLLQKENNAAMGYHHFDRSGVTRMVESISHYMHEILVKHLIESASPFSLILDTSSDIEGRHYIITYFQALEDNTPIVYFYKLIEMSADLSAKAHFDLIVKAITEEKQDLLKYFKSKMVGFASDGAAVMTGRINGLAVQMRTYVTNPIYAVHCMAHKLQLAIGKAYDTNYFSSLDNLINFLYSFYNRGEKREAHLRMTSKRLGSTFYRLTYIYEIRWISSQLRAMQSVHLMWEVLVIDLDEIARDTGFSEDTRSKASQLHKSLKGKSFLLIFNFVLDVLQELSRWSEKMQKRGSLLADYGKFAEQVKTTFTNLKAKNGARLTKYLLDVDCRNVIAYYTKQMVIYQGTRLDNDIKAPKLHLIRDSFLDKVILEIENYFPQGHVKNFDIFVPSNLPKNSGDTSTYGIQEVFWLCDYFKFGDCPDLVEDWKTTLSSITDIDIVCEIRNNHTKTATFWSAILNHSSFPWKERVAKLIKTVLVITTGSVEAERGFSIMNHIKYDRRSRLSATHLEDLLRIRINGPNDIVQFSAQKYAKRWIQEKHIRTDESRAKKDMGTKLALENDITDAVDDDGFSARSSLF